MIGNYPKKTPSTNAMAHAEKKGRGLERFGAETESWRGDTRMFDQQNEIQT
jgi:hypothetical protein